MRNLITDVPGVLVGNAQDRRAATGVTVAIFETSVEANTATAYTTRPSGSPRPSTGSPTIRYVGSATSANANDDASPPTTSSTTIEGSRLSSAHEASTSGLPASEVRSERPFHLATTLSESPTKLWLSAAAKPEMG